MSTANALTTISQDIYAARESFDLARVDVGLNFEREAGFAIQHLGKNKYSMDTAMANRQSVFDAVVNIAAMGRSLNPALKEAYLVPRDGRICLDISYIGLLAIAQESGAILWGQARLVHAQDTFELQGFDAPPRHNYNPFSKDRGEIVGVYVVVKTPSGDYLTDTMSIEEVYAIRDRSSAWKNSKSGPWKTDEGEMIKKTVIKRAYKTWPKSDRLAHAIDHLNTAAGEGIEFEKEEPKKLTAGGFFHPAKAKVELSPEREAIIDAVASSVVDHYNADDLIGAYEEYIGVGDVEEKLALWEKIPNEIRKALRKHGNALKETVAA